MEYNSAIKSDDYSYEWINLGNSGETEAAGAAASLDLPQSPQNTSEPRDGKIRPTDSADNKTEGQVPPAGPKYKQMWTSNRDTRDPAVIRICYGESTGERSPLAESENGGAPL